MAKSASMPSGCEPGALVLYQEPRSLLPLWPSIRLTEEATPASFVRTRPYGSRIIVLKLAPVLNVGQLRWAHPSDIVRFDPSSVNETTERTTPGLNDAFAIAEEANRSDYDLDYWKIMLESSLDVGKVGRDHDDDGYDDEDDENMLLAIKRGIVDASYKAPKSSQFPSCAKARYIDTHARSPTVRPWNSELRMPIRTPLGTSSQLLTPSTSPPRTHHTFGCHSSSSKRPVTISPDLLDTETPSAPQKRRLNYSRESLSRNNSPRNPSQRFVNTSRPTNFDSDEGEYDIVAKRSERTSGTSALLNKRSSVRERPLVSERRQPGSSSPSALRSKSSAYSASDDVIEEDLEESDQFVQVLVGPGIDTTSDCDTDHKRKFLLMKKHVWDRPYFKDAVSARNYFTPIGENTWELLHPELSKISPDDFDPIAEFLSDGGFGIRQPEDEEQFTTFFIQCTTTWQVAEQLSMDDLLNHIVEKVHGVLEWQDLWGLWHPMVFAFLVYQADVALDAHTELKALLSEYIAEHYNAYLGHPYFSDNLLTGLGRRPEMERDILAKRLDRLERQLS